MAERLIILKSIKISELEIFHQIAVHHCDKPSTIPGQSASKYVKPGQ
jgi:hypothetical protein